MGFNFASGLNFDTSSGTNHVKLLASLPSGALLHEVNVQGYAQLGAIAFSLASGVFPSYNLSAGIQYGAVGHIPAGITDGTGAGESWLDFSAHLTAEGLRTEVPASLPASFAEDTSFAINARWRGLLYFATGADIHWELGLDGSRSFKPNFQLDYTWWVGYST